MFPAGAVGGALLLLRFSVAALFLLMVFTGHSSSVSWWEIVAGAGVTMTLCLGVYTPLSSGVCILIEIFEMTAARSTLVLLLLLVSVLITLSLGILGPGAFSLDARMFGRRLIAPDTN